MGREERREVGTDIEVWPGKVRMIRRVGRIGGWIRRRVGRICRRAGRGKGRRRGEFSEGSRGG